VHGGEDKGKARNTICKAEAALKIKRRNRGEGKGGRQGGSGGERGGEGSGERRRGSEGKRGKGF